MLPDVYSFKIHLGSKVSRNLSVRGNRSLHYLAEEILHAFDFDCDHAFGFYDNIKDYSASTEIYELFTDIGERLRPHAKGVRKQLIELVFHPGKKMLFVFDYGDFWEFTVECIGTRMAEKGERFPQVTASKGKAPKQY